MSAQKLGSSWPAGLKITAIATASLSLTLYISFSERASASRCSAGLVASGTRCCPEGQHSDGQVGVCLGTARKCARSQVMTGGGCEVPPHRVALSAGQLTVAPNDWEAQGEVTARSAWVDAFWLDRTETTLRDWNECVGKGNCRALPSPELGLPVTRVSPQEAEAFCRARGGRLPTSDEWMFAAAGEEGRRFPWGQTGLVCRRVVFGLESGPCAHGAAGPELAGSRPDGATPQGLFDMAGNVAEFTRGLSGFEARGGSFRSQLAVELKVWKAQAVHASSYTESDDLGFRCAYDAG